MSAPGARPKFRIDPTAPPAPPPPAAGPTASPKPTPAPAPAAPAPTLAPSNRKKWLIGGAVVAALVLVGAAYAIFGLGVGGFVYPTKYLITSGEEPHGLKFSDPAQASQQTPCEKVENPCKVDAATLDQLADAGARPTEGWVEAFDTPSANDGAVTVLALKFKSSDDATTFSGNAQRICGLGDQHGAVLQDGDVVVILGATSNGGNLYKSQAIAKLKTKASALHQLCSR